MKIRLRVELALVAIVLLCAASFGELVVEVSAGGRKLGDMRLDKEETFNRSIQPCRRYPRSRRQPCGGTDFQQRACSLQLKATCAV
jgi:hypothetical protein